MFKDMTVWHRFEDVNSLRQPGVRLTHMGDFVTVALSRGEQALKRLLGWQALTWSEANN